MMNSIVESNKIIYHIKNKSKLFHDLFSKGLVNDSCKKTQNKWTPCLTFKKTEPLTWTPKFRGNRSMIGILLKIRELWRVTDIILRQTHLQYQRFLTCVQMKSISNFPNATSASPSRRKENPKIVKPPSAMTLDGKWHFLGSSSTADNLSQVSSKDNGG